MTDDDHGEQSESGEAASAAPDVAAAAVDLATRAADMMAKAADATPAQPSRVGVPAWAALLVALVGLGVGAVITTVVTDDGEQEVVDCDDATEVVNAAIDRIDEINSTSQVQDPSFFAALIVEQRTITYSMDAAPTCFPLAERAGAAGLLMGIEGLLTAGVSSQAPSPDATPDGDDAPEPTDDAPEPTDDDGG